MMREPHVGVRRHDAAFQSADASAHPKDWPHAPVHRLGEAGGSMVTAGTYQKIHYLNRPQRLELVMRNLFECGEEFGWELHAWAVLSNHYHFMARSDGDPLTLRRVVGKLHMTTAKAFNQEDATPGRRDWFQYWDGYITFERSYLARLRYVNQNPVHHGVVTDAMSYRWCSAAWFERIATPAFVKTVNSFNIDQVKVPDEF
jgi:putative transposase